MEDKQMAYMEMQQLAQQTQQIHQQLQTVNLQIQELVMTEEALTDIKSTPNGTEILVPISTGIFAKAKLENNENVLLNSGAKISVEKTIEETKTLVKSQLEEMEMMRLELNSKLEEMNSNLAKFQNML